MDAEGGVTVSGTASTIVIVAVFVAPVESEAVRVIVPGHALAAIVTVMVDVFHVALPEVPLKALSGSDEVVKYGPVPPLIVKLTVCVVVLLTTGILGGLISKGPGATVGAVTATLTLPDLPPVEAVIVAVVSAVTVGAVNVASAKPPVVWAKGVTLPLFVVKLTVVPSGTGLPPIVFTAAVIVEVPPEATDCGSANTVT